MSRIAAYCDSAIRAALLAVVIVVPLFFNKYASNAFEPEKVFILRSLALVVLVAWLAHKISDNRIRLDTLKLQPLMLQPLLLPILFWVAVSILSTAFSIDSRLSFWGTYIRGMGLYTLLSCLVIFAATADRMRSLARIEQLITTIVLVSVPISLYGIGQRFGIEPITVLTRETEAFRVTSHLGHPVFLAAFLVLVFPLIIARILILLYGEAPDKQRRQAKTILTLSYAAVGLLLLAALLFTGSRGPLLGLGVGSIVFILLTAAHRNRRRLIVLFVCVCILTTGTLFVLPFLSDLPAAITQRPELQRLSKLLDSGSGTGLTRSLQWRMAYEAATSKLPLNFDEKKQDGLYPVRALIGYGPETIKIISRQYIQPELLRVYGGYFVPDRFHNDFWDTLLTTGIMGLIARFALLGCMLFFSLTALGIVTGLTLRFAFWASYLGGGFVLASIIGAWKGIGFAGFGFCAGTILGLVLFVIYAVCFGGSTRGMTPIPVRHAFWIIALVSAIVAHLVEISFSFSIGTSALYFWVYAGLIIAIARILTQQQSAVEAEPASPLSLPKVKTASVRHTKERTPARITPDKNRAQREFFNPLFASLIFGLMLGTIGFELLRKEQDASLWSILFNSLTRLSGNDSAYELWLVGALVLSWLAFGIVWATEHSLKSSQTSSSRLTTILTWSALVGCLFWTMLAALLTSGGSITQASFSPSYLLLVANYTSATWLYYVFLLLIILLMAYCQPNVDIRQSSPDTTPFSRATVISVLCIFGLAGIYQLNIRRSLADISAAYAMSSTTSEAAGALYQKSIRISPSVDAYRYLLGKRLAEQAIHSTDVQHQSTLFANAQKVLEEGNQLSPLNPDFYSVMADLSLNRALLEPDKQKRMFFSKKTQIHLSSALALEPVNCELWYRQAVLDLIVMRNPPAAHKALKRALEILPDFDKAYALTGDAYAVEAQGNISAQERNRLLSAAAAGYEQAIAIIGPQYSYCNALATTYRALGNLPRAIDLHLKSLDTAPVTEQWRIERDIAELYFVSGNRKEALVHLQHALEQSNDEQKKKLNDSFRNVLSR